MEKIFKISRIHLTTFIYIHDSYLVESMHIAKEGLKSIGEDNAVVTTEECKFCHSESVPEDTEIEIMTNGYFIAKMEGCPKN